MMQDEKSIWIVVYNIIVGFVAWVLAYTGLPIEAAAILGFLMIVDYAMALIVASHLGEDISSKRMKYGALGKLMTFFYPLLIALAFKATGADMNTPLIAGVVILIFGELYSIGSHIAIYKYNYRMPELDAFKLLVGAVGKKLRSMIEAFSDEGGKG